MENNIKFYKSPYDFVKKESIKITLNRTPPPIPNYLITEFYEKIGMVLKENLPEGKKR